LDFIVLECSATATAAAVVVVVVVAVILLVVIAAVAVVIIAHSKDVYILHKNSVTYEVSCHQGMAHSKLAAGADSLQTGRGGCEYVG
jgi:hypothetical protein